MRLPDILHIPDLFLMNMTTKTTAHLQQGRSTSHIRPEVTFEEYAEAWLRMRRGLAERTVELYAWLLRRHINPTMGPIPLRDLRTAYIRVWHSDLAANCPTTAAKSYRLMAHILSGAVEDDFIEVNPCKIKGAGFERPQRRPIASIAEVEKLAGEMPADMSAAVILGAWCQLRRGEVRGLRRRDLDVDNALVSVCITRVVAMSGKNIVKEPKVPASVRTIAIPPHVIDDLTDHLDRFVDFSIDSWVVSASDGALSKAWNRARSAIGRPELRFHDLRHSGLTWLAETGASTAELMKRAGHASAHVSMRYQHAGAEQDRRSAHALTSLATGN